jgi:hypothetical protein
VLFGGTGDRDDLNYWSTLAGERDEPTLTTDLHGRAASRTTRRVPVLAPAQIATLPPGRVVVFTSTIPPVIGRAEKAYQRADVREHHTPGALTVRIRVALRAARRWTLARAGRGLRWVASVTAPVRSWVRAHVGGPVARLGRRLGGRLRGVRAWLTGTERGTGYLPFQAADLDPPTAPVAVIPTRVVPEDPDGSG